MKTSTILAKSLKVLEQEGWTKGPLARNKYRHQVRPTNPNATKFCSMGAVCKVMGYGGWGNETPSPKYFDVLNNLTEACNELDNSRYYHIASYNDDPIRTFPEVKKVFKLAIKNAKAQGN